VFMGDPSLRDSTVLSRLSEGVCRFASEISTDWTVVHVFGGVGMYVALRAMVEALNRNELSPLTATALFLAPLPAGHVLIDVDSLRQGRGTAQLIARVRPADSDEPAISVQALFGGMRPAGLTFQSIEPPVVPPPQDVPARRHNPGMHFAADDRTEWRPILGLDDPHDGRVLAWQRLRVWEPDLLALTFHSDILGSTIQPRGFSTASLEIAVRFLATPATAWVLQEVEAWHVGDGYATGPARLWDERGRLCAIVNQTAVLRPAHARQANT
jgi:acyl-CoA thioesterase